MRDFVGTVSDVQAVGHRVVHGGRELVDPLVLDRAGIERLGELSDLAPLHNAPALRVIVALRGICPDVPHVACFDTAFHAGIRRPGRSTPCPADWSERFGLRRFGFHGISHAWAARRAAGLLDRPAAGLRLVTCHLGAGASLAAVRDGASVDTTMGFTPNEGLVMATRSGSVDPGMLLWLIRHAGIAPDVVEQGLEHESGLRGLSGTSGDMREVIAAAATTGAPAPRWRSTSTASARASPPWPRPWTVWTRWSSPAAWASTRRGCEPRRAVASGFSGSVWTRERTRRMERATGRSGPPGDRCECWWWRAARSRRSH